MKKDKRTYLLLALTVLIGLSLYWLGWRFDNKYTAYRHPAKMGLTWLNEQRYAERPLLHLVDGWEYYAGALLTPEELEAETRAPDAYLYLGRYGGFDLGQAEAPRHGQATYRLTILTGCAEEREYALELTPIYTEWRLWINGELRQQVGFDASDASDALPEQPRPPDPSQHDMVVFRAAERIDIVVAVRDEAGLYSGMVYPPAFGSPRALASLLTTRLLLHAASALAALLIGAFWLVVGRSLRYQQPYGLLFGLCFCFALTTSYPLFAALGWAGEAWAVAERLAYYALFTLMLRLQDRICGGGSQRTMRLWTVLGLLVCASVVLQPWIVWERAAAYYLYGDMLAAYKHATALYLVVNGIRAVRRSEPGSAALMAGIGLFAAALLFDRLKPLYEPILLGWPLELACLAMIAIIAGLLWQDTIRVYRENLLIQEEQKLADLQIDAQRRYAELQREYLQRSERALHEVRNRLTLIRFYALQGQTAELLTYLEELLERSSYQVIAYSGYPLIDALLSIELSRAEELGIYCEWEMALDPEQIFLSDNDLTTVLMNVLDNALRACSQLPNREERWLYLSLEGDAHRLTLRCSNAACEAGEEKPSPPGHGYGLQIIAAVAERYGGRVETVREQESFDIAVLLFREGADSRGDFPNRP